jgi:putative inorganic carbon (HCO3(-)) transporter
LRTGRREGEPATPAEREHALKASLRAGWVLAAFAGLLGVGLLLVATRAAPQEGAAVAVVPALLIIVPAVAFFAWNIEPVWLLCAAIVLSPLAGNWPEVGIPGILAPDRLLLVIGIASVLVRSSALGDNPIRVGPIHSLMIVAVGFVATSAWVSGSFTQVDWFAKLFDTFGVVPFLLFLVVPVAFRERRQRDILLATLVIFGAYLSLTTLFERVHLDALVFPHYILDPNYGIHAGRGRGPFVEAVTNGFALYMCVVACAIAFKQWRARGLPNRANLAAAVALLCVAGIVMSLERSVWIAAILATFVTVCTLSEERRAAIRAMAVVAIAVVVSLLLIPGLYGEATARFNDSQSVHDRENLNRAALNMIEARPLLGFGWGEFVPNSYNYFEQANDYPLGNVAGLEIHSTVLVYAVELGLIGVALWILVVVAGVSGGLSRRGPPDLDDWRVGLLAVAVAYAAIVNFVPPQAFPNLALWLWAGIGWIGYQGEPKAG